MPDIKDDLGMYTSRFRALGGTTHTGVKCRRHLIPWPIPLHLHDFYEIELVLHGEMSQTVDGVSVTSRMGDFVFMDLLSVQRIAASATPPEVWTISISPSEADPALIRLLARAKFPLVGTLPSEALAEFDQLSTLLVTELERKTPHTAERITALTTLLVTLLLEHGEAPAASAAEPRAYHYIQKALVYLNESYASPLTLGDVARHIHISPCYLSDLFSRIVGCRFVEYLTRLRLEHAQSMLRGNAPVSTVAAACGFGTVSNFTRAHRRAFGVAPSQWRREQDEANDS